MIFLSILNAVVLRDTGPLTLFGETYPKARCLDGTAAGLYLRRATSTETRKNWIIVLDGGGLCTHKADCTARANTSLGSSKFFSKSFNFSKFSFTSSDPANPFAEWNKVFVPYCSGDMWSGQRMMATDETFGLFFAGHLVVEATIDWLSHEGLNISGSHLIFSGGSAGGVGAFTNMDFVAAMLPTVKVLGAPVGGFPPEITWYPGVPPPEEDVRDSGFERFVPLFKSYMNEMCVAGLSPTSRQALCFVPRILYQFLVTPVFVIEALIDATVLGGFEAIPVSKVLNQRVIAFVNDYGINASRNFEQIRASFGRARGDGLYAPDCLMHCGFLLNRPLISGLSAPVALHRWWLAHTSGNITNDFILEDLPRIVDPYFPPHNGHCPPSVD